MTRYLEIDGRSRSTFALKLLDATTAQQRDLFEVRDRKIVFPSFSPGGERVAFFNRVRHLALHTACDHSQAG